MSAEPGYMKTEIPFYKNTGDTLRDVGISARQLAYWRKEGLFSSQLGDNKRYTERDIKLLKFLKKLVDPKDGYGLPVDRVRELISTAPISPDAFWSVPRYLDLEEDKFVSRRWAFMEYVQWAKQGYFVLDDDFLLEIAFLFMRVYSKTISPKVYAANRESLMEKLHEVDLMARIQVTRRELTEGEWRGYKNADIEPPEFVEEYSISPALSDDPKLTESQMQVLLQKRALFLRRNNEVG